MRLKGRLPISLNWREWAEMPSSIDGEAWWRVSMGNWYDLSLSRRWERGLIMMLSLLLSRVTDDESSSTIYSTQLSLVKSGQLFHKVEALPALMSGESSDFYPKW
jgi:hypothetical protein